MPDSEMPSSLNLRFVPMDRPHPISSVSSHETVLSLRGLFWGIFFEAIAVLLLALTWGLWHLCCRLI